MPTSPPPAHTNPAADHVVPGEALSIDDMENKANLTTLLDGEYLIVSGSKGVWSAAHWGA